MHSLASPSMSICRSRRLSRPEQQVVEIVRALGGKPGALLLDEPTATLNQEESERLFALIDRMKEQGWGLLYITHRLDEVRRLGDRVTVLRDGAVVATHLIGDVSDDQLIQEMVGRQMDRLYPHIRQNPTIEALRADHLYTVDGRVRDASFICPPRRDCRHRGACGVRKV